MGNSHSRLAQRKPRGARVAIFRVDGECDESNGTLGQVPGGDSMPFDAQVDVTDARFRSWDRGLSAGAWHVLIDENRVSIRV